MTVGKGGGGCESSRDEGGGAARTRRLCDGFLRQRQGLDLGETAVKLRLERPDAPLQRRVRGEEVEKRAGKGVAEEHVADFVGVAVANPRAIGQAADLLQRPGDPARVARELDGRGVGQELTLPDDGRT